MKVLIIDDDEDLRNLLAHYLNQEWPELEVEQFDPLQREMPDASFPLRDYDVWMGGLFRSSVPQRSPLLPRWMAAVCLLSILAVVIVFLFAYSYRVWKTDPAKRTS